MPGMRRTIMSLSILAVLMSAFARCQSAPPVKPPQFDHASVYVRDLQKSAEFYDKVLGLERMPEPFHDGRHVWYRIGPNDQLHVISGAASAVQPDVDVHLAFHVTDFREFVSRLDRIAISYRKSVHGDGKTATIRPDGVHQVYFQDPDGYWIEVNDHNF
jgi:lactoylglutathione lyase